MSRIIPFVLAFLSGIDGAPNTTVSFMLRLNGISCHFIDKFIAKLQFNFVVPFQFQSSQLMDLDLSPYGSINTILEKAVQPGAFAAVVLASYAFMKLTFWVRIL